MKYEDKICIVTGGADGIGRCITQAFIEKGARVAVIDTDASSGTTLAETYGDRLLFIQGDIADKDTLEHFAKTVLSACVKVSYNFV